MTQPPPESQDFSPQAEAVDCPRCGYDQRGLMTGWETQCPLQGTCSECGLEYSWGQVLDPARFEPKWCVEFAPRSIRRILRASLSTFFRSFHPWRFWSRLKMSDRIRPWRLAMHALFLLLLPVGGYAAVQGAAAVYVRWLVGDSYSAANIQTGITRLQGYITKIQQGLQSNRYNAMQAQQAIANAQAQVTWLQNLKDPIQMSYAEAVVEAVFFPASTTSGGTVSVMNGTMPYPAPAELYEVIDSKLNASNFFGRGGGVNAVWTGKMIASGAAGSLLIAMMPLSLLLLPVSRRRAKVKWAHIGRVAAYGLFIAPSALIIFAGLTAAAMANGYIGNLGQDWLRHAAVWIIPTMLWLWWGAAINRYLKIGHGLMTAGLLLVMCALLMAMVVWFAAPDVLIHWNF